jgi:hypothetical protein
MQCCRLPCRPPRSIAPCRRACSSASRTADDARPSRRAEGTSPYPNSTRPSASGGPKNPKPPAAMPSDDLRTTYIVKSGSGDADAANDLNGSISSRKGYSACHRSPGRSSRATMRRARAGVMGSKATVRLLRVVRRSSQGEERASAPTDDRSPIGRSRIARARQRLNRGP